MQHDKHMIVLVSVGGILAAVACIIFALRGML